MHGDDTASVGLLTRLSATYSPTNADSVIHYADQAMALAKKIHYPNGQAVAASYAATYYRTKGDYNTALNHLLLSIKIYEALHDVAQMADNYLEIAQVYKDMAGAAQTLAYINKGIWYSWYSHDLYKSIQDTAGIINSLNECGIL